MPKERIIYLYYSYSSIRAKADRSQQSLGHAVFVLFSGC